MQDIKIASCLQLLPCFAGNLEGSQITALQQIIVEHLLCYSNDGQIEVRQI